MNGRETANPQSSVARGDRVSLQQLQERLSDEVKKAAEDCHDLQVLTSRLLEKLNHPDLRSEYHMLQELDRLSQTLLDLARLSSLLARVRPDRDIDEWAVSETLSLASVRDRFLPHLADGDSGEQEDGMTWF